MNKLIRNGLFAFSCSLGISVLNPVSADEISERHALTQHIQQLYTEKNYDELNSIYNNALKKQTRTSSGIWTLRQLYEAFGASFKHIDAEDEYAWDQQKNMLDQWIKYSPNVALPKILHAKLLESRAWAYRGQEYASKVTEEGWVGFKKFNLEDQAYLNTIKKDVTQDPEWYVSRLNNASYLKADEESYQKPFKEATDKHPLYYTLYFDAINFHYHPKWGGSKATMEKLANFAVSKTQKQEGTALYSRIYWVIAAHYQRTDLKKDTLVNWLRMKQSVNQVLKKYPTQWNYANFATIACYSKDQALTRKLFQSIPSYHPEDWNKLEVYNYCKAYAFNAFNELAKQLNAHTAERERLYSEAIRANKNANPPTEFYEQLQDEIERKVPPFVFK